MKRVFGLLFLVLASLTLAGGCSGADNVSGPDEGPTVAPTRTPGSGSHPRPTPNPCRQNPADCD